MRQMRLPRALRAVTERGLGLSLSLLAIFGMAAVVAQTYSRTAKTFPTVVGLIAIIALIAEIRNDIRQKPDERASESETQSSDRSPSEDGERLEAQKGGLRYWAWIVFYCATFYLFGAFIAMCAFLFLYFVLENRAPWYKAALVSGFFSYALVYQVAPLAGLGVPDSIFQILPG